MPSHPHRPELQPATPTFHPVLHMHTCSPTHTGPSNSLPHESHTYIPHMPPPYPTSAIATYIPHMPPPSPSPASATATYIPHMPPHTPASATATYIPHVLHVPPPACTTATFIPHVLHVPHPACTTPIYIPHMLHVPPPACTTATYIPHVLHVPPPSCVVHRGWAGQGLLRPAHVVHKLDPGGWDGAGGGQGLEAAEQRVLPGEGGRACGGRQTEPRGPARGGHEGEGGSKQI